MRQATLFLCLIFTLTAFAQMPKTLNYQGTLALGSTAVPDGNYNVTFRLYTTSTGGSAVWTEAQLVTTRNGVFNAILGKIVALPGSFNTSYWLSLQVGADPELSPRLEMTAVSYSMQSAVADSAKKVADGSINAAALGTGAVTTTKLLDASVTGAKIVDATITGTDVAAGTLTAGNILDEPGLSSSYSNTFIYPPVGGAITVCDSVDITLLAPGYVFVISTGYIQLYHTNATPTRVDVSLNNVRSVMGSGGVMGLVPAVNSTGPYGYPFTVTRVFSEASPGAKRFYLLAAYNFGSNSSTNIPSVTTTALYFPTLLGTSSAPPFRVPVSTGEFAPDGTVRPGR
jgi:hypothetical protein